MTVIVVALGGVAVNAVTALMFASGRKGDLNIRGAFLHMASDALVALGVAVSGALFLLTGWTWIDPAVSLAIGGFIVLGAWSLMRESLDLALQAVPTGVDRAGVLGYLRALPGVDEVHDLHIWGMSTTETALTAHLVRPRGQVGRPAPPRRLRRPAGQVQDPPRHPAGRGRKRDASVRTGGGRGGVSHSYSARGGGGPPAEERVVVEAASARISPTTGSKPSRFKISRAEMRTTRAPSP